MTAVALAAALVATLPWGAWLITPLEDRFPPVAALPEDAAGLIVLGGAVRQRITAARDQVGLTEAAERMTSFVALARAHPELPRVFTGGSGLVNHQDLKEVAVARRFFAEMGLDPESVTYEDRSRNTWENAVRTASLIEPAPHGPWILITTASHMPRAVGVFRKAGWRIVPYPVDYRTTGEPGTFGWHGLTGGLAALEEATREWLALAAYRLMGRTDAVFPGPEG